MKALVLAFGLSATAGAADAATYKFSYIGEHLQPEEGWFEECSSWGGCDYYTDTRIYVELIFRLPDLISRTITFFAYCPSHGCDEDEYERDSNFAFLSSRYEIKRDGENHEWQLPYLYEYGELKTDASGNLISASWSGDSDTPDVGAYWNAAFPEFRGSGWGSSSSSWFGASGGTWTVSQVPVPAGGLLLFASLAALVLKRRRRA